MHCSVLWWQHTPCVDVGSLHTPDGVHACPGAPPVHMRMCVPGHGCLLAVAALPTTHLPSGQLRLGAVLVATAWLERSYSAHAYLFCSAASLWLLAVQPRCLLVDAYLLCRAGPVWPA